jgi:hypothetical protein
LGPSWSWIAKRARRKSCGLGSAAQSGEHTNSGPAEGSVAVSWLAMSRCGLRAQLGDDRQDGAGHHTGAACADLCDQASCGPHVRAWCAHSRYAKSGGRFHPCRPGVEPRRCDVGRDAKHWGSFNEALSTVATRRAISARSRIPRKNLFQARLALSRGGTVEVGSTARPCAAPG